MKRRFDFAVMMICFWSLALIFAVQQPARAQDKATNAQPGTPRLKLEPCPGPAEKEALCGKYEVFENRATRSGRKIALNVMMLPASAATREPDPVFYLEGGPGGAAVATGKAGGRRPFFDLLRKRRDVVFVDQRGTGESNRLACEMADPADLRTYFGERFPVERVKQCRTELEKIADLTLYSTPIAMDDLDEVRDALGYQRINLYGGSYGSIAAMSYLRQHGDHVRSIVIAGVAPIDYRLPLPIAKGVQHALDRLFEDCAANDGCRTTYPNLKAEFAEVLARLEKEPANVNLTDPATRKSQAVTISRNAFTEHLRLLLYFPQMMSRIPLVIHQAHENDYTLFGIYALTYSRLIENTIARGMHLSVVCGEDLPFISESDIVRETAGTVYGDTLVRSYKKACENWPRPQIPASFVEPVKSNAAVLMLSGDLDPVTPPWLAAAAVKHLANGRQLVIRNGSHSTVTDCTEGLAADFIAKGSAKDLDATCVDKIRRLPFNLGAMSGQRPPEGSTPHSTWEGVLAVGAARVRLVLKVLRTPDGKYVATLDSPDQGVNDIPVDLVTIDRGTLRFESGTVVGAFEGKLSADGTEAVGAWDQGSPIQLTMKRVNSQK